MRSLLLAILVTYVSAIQLPQLRAAQLVAEDEQMAEASMLETLRDHEGDHEQKNIFDLLAPALKGFFSYLNSLSDEDLGLDKSTSTGFEKGTDEVLWMIYEDACKQGENCSSPFMGCNCHGHFRGLKENMCKQMPCTAVKHMIDNTASFLRTMRDQKTLNDLIGAGMKFAEPLMKSACHCNPSLFSAATSCMKDYNGDLIEGRKDKKAYRKAVKKIKFDEMQKFASTMFKAYCGTEDGVCLESFRNIFTEMGAMMDRSCAGKQEDQCHNFRRLSDGIYEFIGFLTEDREEDLTLKQIVGKFYRAIPHRFWCGDAKCSAGFLSKIFNNNCCFRNAVNTLDEDVIQMMEKFMRSMVRSMGGQIPRFGKGVRRNISKAVNPNRACARNYAEAAEKCDSLKYYLL